jgi:hypothetical protein
LLCPQGASIFRPNARRESIAIVPALACSSARSGLSK